MRKVIGLFPTPVMKVDGLINADIVNQLRDQALATRKENNISTDLLSHTKMINPNDNSAFATISEIVKPEVVQFGTLMFGEELPWTIKEMWLNVLESGGSQFMHTHANSFISGVVYLTKPDPSTNTVFTKNMGSSEFIFKHDNANCEINMFNTDKWTVPEIEAGDLVLFPSYLLHGVPPNDGQQRITVAFNTIPKRLASWDYQIELA